MGCLLPVVTVAIPVVAVGLFLLGLVSSIRRFAKTRNVDTTTSLLAYAVPVLAVVATIVFFQQLPELPFPTSDPVGGGGAFIEWGEAAADTIRGAPPSNIHASWESLWDIIAHGLRTVAGVIVLIFFVVVAIVAVIVLWLYNATTGFLDELFCGRLITMLFTVAAATLFAWLVRLVAWIWCRRESNS